MVHLMSAGKLVIARKHTKTARLVVAFESGTELIMTETGSKRRAGVWLLTPQDLAAELAHIGPEPLDPSFTVEVLARQAQEHPHLLHGFLRDQRAIAGIGRAFANEILWAAMLSPNTRSAKLDGRRTRAAAHGDRDGAGRRGRAAGSAVAERVSPPRPPAATWCTTRRARPARAAAIKSEPCPLTNTRCSTAQPVRPRGGCSPTGGCRASCGTDLPFRGYEPHNCIQTGSPVRSPSGAPGTHPRRRDRRAEGHPHRPRRHRARLLRRHRLLRRSRSVAEGRAHVALPRDGGRGDRRGGDRRGPARRGSGRAHRSRRRHAPEGGAQRGHDPGQVPGHPAHAGDRPADAGDLPPDRPLAGQRQIERGAWSASRCAV